MIPKKYDIVFAVVVLLVFGAQFLTTVITARINDYCGYVGAAEKYVEANKLASVVLLLDGEAALIKTLIFPAAAIAMYIFYIRKLYGKISPDAFHFIFAFMAVAMSLDFLNDLAVLIGVMG